MSEEAIRAEFVAVIPDVDGFVLYRLVCPECNASFDIDFDARVRDEDVACDNCPWKGKIEK